MSYAVNADCAGGGFSPQTFKTNKTNWMARYRAYDSADMQSMTNNYDNVLGAIEAANNAIASSGVDGVSRIPLSFNRSQTAAIEEKRIKLSDFSSGVYDDADDLIEHPFYEAISKVKGNTDEHKTLTITYMGTTGEIPYEYSNPEGIKQWMYAAISSANIDDFLYTNDPEKNAIIDEYMTYDIATDTYGFEKAMDEWDTLSDTKQEVLAHCYEYAYRQYEMVFDEDAVDAHQKHEILERMANKCVSSNYDSSLPYQLQGAGSVTAISDAGKGICSRLGDDSRGKEFLEAIEKEPLFGDYKITVRHDRAATVFEAERIDHKPAQGSTSSSYFSDSFTSTPPRPYDNNMGTKGVIGLDEVTNGKKVVAYCTSNQRSLAYVYHEAENNPGCYKAQEATGLTKEYFAVMLTAAENSYDSLVLDRLTKSTGNYNEMLDVSPSLLSDSCKGMITQRQQILTYLATAENNETARREAAAFNVFKGENTGTYSNAYQAMYDEQIAILNNIPEEQISEGEAILRGAENSFLLLPNAIDGLYIKLDSQNLQTVSIDGVENIHGNISGNYSGDDYSLDAMSLPIDERLNYYKAKAERAQSMYMKQCEYASKNPSSSGLVYIPIQTTFLPHDELEDLKNIYFSYVAYCKHESEQLRLTDDMLDNLSAIRALLERADTAYLLETGLNEENAKIELARKQHPNYFKGGEIAGDALIYLLAGPAIGTESALAQGTLKAGAKVALKNVIKGTVLDFVIKDAPTAALEYANGEDLGTVVEHLSVNVMTSAAGNVLGEGVSIAADGATSAAKSAITKKTTQALVDTYHGLDNTGNFLSNLSKEELGLLAQGLEKNEAIKVLSKFDESTVKSVISTMPETAGKELAEGVTKAKAKDLASDLYKRASSIEAVTTDVMKSLEVDGAHLEGLDHRLKTQESLERKIISNSNTQGISLVESASDINDSLRYTLVTSNDKYVDTFYKTLDELEKKGYTVVEVNNYWGRPDYKGINTIIQAPDGTNIELQFHTDASYYTKEQLNHSWYEIYRNEASSLSEKQEAMRVMTQNASKIDVPIIENRLYKEQGQMALNAFNKGSGKVVSDSDGNITKYLTREEATELSNVLKKQLDDVPQYLAGDYRVPEPEKIAGITVYKDGSVRIKEAWKDGTDGAKSGTRRMEIVTAVDENGKPVVIDRIGAENGNYFSPMKDDGTPYSLKERAIGDYLAYDELADNSSYHQYIVKKDFTRKNFEEAIDNSTMNLNNKAKMKERLADYYDDAVSVTDTLGHDGEQYSDLAPDLADGVKTGEIDQMFLKDGDIYHKGTDGGGKQFITPFNVNELIELGMIEKIY
jgi:hypothetical protein